MNILDFLLGNLLPISSATLSLVTALVSTIVTRKWNNSHNDIRVKINVHEIKLEGFDEKEVIELLEKLNAEKNKTEEIKKIMNRIDLSICKIIEQCFAKGSS